MYTRDKALPPGGAFLFTPAFKMENEQQRHL